MTELAAATVTADTPSRLSLPVRLVLLVLAAIALVFSVGLIAGIVVASFEQSLLKPRGAALLAGAVIAATALGWSCWKLSAHWRRSGRSAYEKRYSKMMWVLFAAGMPIGVLIGFAGDGQPGTSLFSNGPLDPRLAAVAAVGLVVTLAGTLVLYHRSIDDHEQQAYLWANSLAFYFLALALPAAWLLARGGLIGAIGIGSVMLILLAAFCINFAVWAWLKYR
ncbi:hypothetical protein GGQ97_001428 [Sphingomonas kaistensis]|uniref:DUF2157 domain-containing protein n=1 Tax=Sphingomonas kaistensis TaxID=298708 RepID=A0A7X5Y844_9SPHN|nr:hypothetical protein [Sphingomonas kaistensis]NJC05635.1 hypothetical protein [Sphingomonas kaistensis]